jgi:hypothetical protein
VSNLPGMRVLFMIFGAMFFLSVNAQQGLPPGIMNNSGIGVMPYYRPQMDSSALNSKWSFQKYVGISSGFGFFNGGQSSVISAPVGMQLNRRLNKNLYAFAGLTVAPSYFTYNRSFNDFNIYKSNPGNTRFNSNGFGIYSRAEAGLMYINDERTFSISGSIGIDRSNYPAYPAYPVSGTSPQRQQPFVGTR